MSQYQRKTPKKPRATAPSGESALSPAEFEALASEALGGRGWQKTFARGTKLSPSTITRYLQGVFPIPVYVALLVEMLLTLRRNGLPVPDRFTEETSSTLGK